MSLKAKKEKRGKVSVMSLVYFIRLKMTFVSGLHSQDRASGDSCLASLKLALYVCLKTSFSGVILILSIRHNTSTILYYRSNPDSNIPFTYLLRETIFSLVYFCFLSKGELASESRSKTNTSAINLSSLWTGQNNN